MADQLLTDAMENAWNPISSAPRGIMTLFCDMNATELRNSFFVDWMVDGAFCGNRHHTATHWMPLPEPPKETDDGR